MSNKTYESSAYELAYTYDGKRSVLCFKYESSMRQAYELFEKLGLDPAIISE